jgi:hypothetical protein
MRVIGTGKTLVDCLPGLRAYHLRSRFELSRRRRSAVGMKVGPTDVKEDGCLETGTAREVIKVATALRRIPCKQRKHDETGAVRDGVQGYARGSPGLSVEGTINWRLNVVGEDS